MRKYILIVSLIVLSTLGLSRAEDNGFDKELSSLRKNIISMCAQLQAGQPKESQEQLLKEIDGIISGWEGMASAYKATPPAEYSKDPAWKSYFDEALDNFRIMRQKAEEKKYGRAMQFCGYNCSLFVKIHEVNGRSTLTDKMFMLRQNVRLAVSMAKAENWAGAQETIKKCSSNLNEIKKYPKPQNNDENEYSLDINQVESAYNKIMEVINNRNIQAIDGQLKSFIEDFGKIYKKYI